MGSPAIFSGKYSKLLTSKGILNSDGSINQFDGPINYVKYAEFEQGQTTGWSLGTTGTLTNAIPTGVPTFYNGTPVPGVSAGLSISAQSTGALRGSYSLQYASSTTTVVGNMLASDTLTIDPADQAKVLTFKFYYSVTANLGNGNFSGTSSNSFGVAVYDVTNSQWLGVAGNFSMTQSSGIGLASGTFQTGATTSQIRLVIYNANASAGAITMLFDDFFVGPQTAPIGPVVTDWQAFTGTASWTGTLNSWEKRIGDSANYRFYLVLNNTQVGSLTFNLPSGRTIDTNKMLGIGTDTPVVGKFRIIRQGTNIWSGDVILTASTGTAFSLRFPTAAGATSPVPTNSVITSASPASFLATDAVEVEIYNIPISGWSSQVVSSSDTDTRVIAFRASGSATIVSGTLSAGTALIKFTPVSDSAGAYSSSTGLYTVPVTGYYTVSAGLGLTGSGTNGYLTVKASRNGGVTQSTFTNILIGAQSNGSYANGSCVIYCNAGDTLTVYGESNFTSPVLSSTDSGFFCVNRLSGPSVIAATESVNCRVNGSTSTIGTGASLISYANKNYDSHSAFSSNTYTVPVSGKYSVKAWIQTNLITLGTTNSVNIFIYLNGAQYSTNYVIGNGAANNAYTVSITDTINCVAGNTISIYALSGVATSALAAYLDIERVGN